MPEQIATDELKEFVIKYEQIGGKLSENLMEFEEERSEVKWSE